MPHSTSVIPVPGELRQENQKVQGLPGLHDKLEASLGYITRPCFNKERRVEGREKRKVAKESTTAVLACVTNDWNDRDKEN